MLLILIIPYRTAITHLCSSPAMNVMNYELITLLHKCRHKFLLTKKTILRVMYCHVLCVCHVFTNYELQSLVHPTISFDRYRFSSGITPNHFLQCC